MTQYPQMDFTRAHEERLIAAEQLIAKQNAMLEALDKRLDGAKEYCIKLAGYIQSNHKRISDLETKWDALSDELVQHLALHKEGKTAPLGAPTTIEAPAAKTPGEQTDENLHPFAR